MSPCAWVVGLPPGSATAPAIRPHPRIAARSLPSGVTAEFLPATRHLAIAGSDVRMRVHEADQLGQADVGSMGKVPQHRVHHGEILGRVDLELDLRAAEFGRRLDVGQAVETRSLPEEKGAVLAPQGITAAALRFGEPRHGKPLDLHAWWPCGRQIIADEV